MFEEAARAAWQHLHPDENWDNLTPADQRSWTQYVGWSVRQAEYTTNPDRFQQPPYIYRDDRDVLHNGVINDVTRRFQDDTEVRRVIDVTAEDFRTQWDPTTSYPFFDDREGTGIYGHGHTDQAEFVATVNTWSNWFSEEEPRYYAADVQHLWGVAMTTGPDSPREEWMLLLDEVTAETPGAFPVTAILW
ncbi:hypothetical protein ASF30_11080 [Leifsonia sp. Leaf264]|nr:hypothetical protein ASF30_11080 [Leifsonia sp. Leaf264]